MYINAQQWYMSQDGFLYDDFGRMVLCQKCCEENNLILFRDGERLLKMGAYLKEYGERTVKCHCCGRVEVDEHLKPEQDLEKLKRKELII